LTNTALGHNVSEFAHRPERETTFHGRSHLGKFLLESVIHFWKRRSDAWARNWLSPMRQVSECASDDSPDQVALFFVVHHFGSLLAKVMPLQTRL
jgi:hypothetical protein